MTRTQHAALKPANPIASGSMLSDEQWSSIAQTLNITPREQQVIRGIFDGLNEALIADELKISTHTVHTHLDRLYRKLNVSCRCNLVIRIFAEYIALYPNNAQERSAGLCA